MITCGQFVETEDGGEAGDDDEEDSRDDHHDEDRSAGVEDGKFGRESDVALSPPHGVGDTAPDVGLLQEEFGAGG